MNIKPLLLLVLLATPVLVGAQEFQPLTGVPALEPLTEGPADLSAFFNQLYVLAVGAAAIVAVVQIMIAGFNLAYSGGNYGAIKEARSKIQNAVLGLLLVLSPTIVFGIINPDILNLSIDTRILERNEVTEDGTYTQDPLVVEAGSSLTQNKYGEFEGVCNLGAEGTLSGEAKIDRFTSLESLGKGDVVVGRACCRLMAGEITKNDPDTCVLDQLIDSERFALVADVNVLLKGRDGEDYQEQAIVWTSGANPYHGFVTNVPFAGTFDFTRIDPELVAIHGFHTKSACTSIENRAGIERQLLRQSSGAGLLRINQKTAVWEGEDNTYIPIEDVLRVVTIHSTTCYTKEFHDR